MDENPEFAKEFNEYSKNMVASIKAKDGGLYFSELKLAIETKNASRLEKLLLKGTNLMNLITFEQYALENEEIDQILSVVGTSESYDLKDEAQLNSYIQDVEKRLEQSGLLPGSGNQDEARGLGQGIALFIIFAVVIVGVAVVAGVVTVASALTEVQAEIGIKITDPNGGRTYKEILVSEIFEIGTVR